MTTPHVKFKQGAETRVIRPAGVRILGAIDRVAQMLDIVLTITSGSEERGRNSIDPHMMGEAFDLSVLGFEPATIRRIWSHLRHLLGSQGFTVLLESPTWLVPAELSDIVYVNNKATAMHIHIQRKKGTIWPPPAS